ncbi:hypothetical protein GCM10017783_25100 [Deinococcus piscis]|uniref:Secreted protein n=1 Tax=Deinococcus piscis TaxID=394230 RepID=A0ABQ3KB80_9DEIO|nr:hypothetical protein GCM10017783_25100 [Deinococcus piscis]
MIVFMAVALALYAWPISASFCPFSNTVFCCVRLSLLLSSRASSANGAAKVTSRSGMFSYPALAQMAHRTP